MMRKFFTITCLILIFGASTFAQQKPDPRVKAALESAKIKYNIAKSGNFLVKFRHNNGRTHTAVIESGTEKYFDLEIREMYAIIYKSKEPLNKKLARKLLIDGGKKKLGGWEYYVSKKNGLHLVYFAVQIDANASGKKLFSYADFVTGVADKMEKNLFETDDF